LRHRKRSRVLRRAYLDLTGATDQFSLAAIVGTADSTRLLYGSGFPYCSVADAVEALGKHDANVLTENCERLLAQKNTQSCPAD